MAFDKIIPAEPLKPYVKYFVISESASEGTYKVLPSTGLVVGFQYRGRLALIGGNGGNVLATAGITGIANGPKVFMNTVGTGTILVYFTEIGFTHFATVPANDLFNQSISLDHIFDKHKVSEAEEKLSLVETSRQRISVVEQFLLSQLKDIQHDKLIVEAVRLIYQSKGTIRMKTLLEQLFISQSPFEKRFRKLVGATPKKFASIVRFNMVLDDLGSNKSLVEICYENGFFDQAHFIKDFKQFTGDAPEKFKHLL